MSKINSKPIDCFKCKYLYITWDESNPRGCTAFGFKTKRLPSLVVLEASGEPCHKLTPKDNPVNSTTEKQTGWIA